MNIFRSATLTLALSCLSMAACGPDLKEGPDGDPCTDACLVGESAVLCELNAGNIQILCAPSVAVASLSCSEAGGVAKAVDVCPLGGGDDEAGEGEDGSEQSSWSPSELVELDIESGVFVIDLEALEELKRDPTPLFQEKTHLGLVEDGRYRVTRMGPLGAAMGWEVGDVLITLNGYEIRGLDSFSNVLELIEGESEFQLNGMRGEEVMVLSYRVE
ncbi:hypothetical protein [Plesiocystis pacifica]|uniref:hypothetical protein n=1 Tax=Plesiocystis pacifica TaxID=191768 RepID=UPI0012FB2D58|nr:hypothetical protein [Plesiocystis pacifica]